MEESPADLQTTRLRNPDWSRNDTILVLDLYRKAPRAGATRSAVIALSRDLNIVARHAGAEPVATFRNPPPTSPCNCEISSGMTRPLRIGIQGSGRAERSTCKPGGTWLPITSGWPQRSCVFGLRSTSRRKTGQRNWLTWVSDRSSTGSRAQAYARQCPSASIRLARPASSQSVEIRR